jgi:succinoglycan biosynthesis transport protein ExoP
MKAADIRFYGAIMRRWLPAALLVTALTTAAGTFIAFALPTVYKATATILVESPQLPTELARSTVQQNAVAQVELAREQLMTDLALERLADAMGLLPAGKEHTDAELDSIRDNIQLDQIRFGSGDQAMNAFTVSFSAADPKTAARVANKLASDILESDMERRQNRASSALDFFRTDVTELADALKKSEAELLAFRTANINALPESLAFRREQIATAHTTLLGLDEEEAAARLRRASLLSVVDTGGEGASVEARMLADLKQTLSTQEARFTPESPVVRTLQQRIKALEDVVSMGAVGPSGAGSGEIKAIDARLAEIDQARATLTSTAATLEATLVETPRIESSLRALELQRDTIQAQYRAAVDRLAEASAGERVEALLKGERLTIFQEALPPQHARQPQKKLVVIAAAFLGLALVAAAAMLGELLNARLRRPSDLQRRLAIEPLAVIPEFTREKKHNRRPAKPVKRGAYALTSALPLNGRESWTT